MALPKGEFRIDPPDGVGGGFPSIAALENGGFVVCWSDAKYYMPCIQAQIFDSSGTKHGSVIEVSDVHDAFRELSSSVTALRDGGFVVAWEFFAPTDDPTTSGIVNADARIFDDAGAAGSVVHLTSNTTDPGLGSGYVAVAGLANGGFVATWTDVKSSSADPANIRAQVFSAGGVGETPALSVPTYTSSGQWDSKVTALENGGFVVCWWDESGSLGDSSLYSVKAQIYSQTGAKVGSEFRMNTTTAGAQYYPSISALGDGFVACWQDSSKEGDIKAQRFSATGQRIGAEITVNTFRAGYQSDPDIAALPNGNFVVVWSDDHFRMDDGYRRDYTVKAQLLSASGEKIGEEFLVCARPEGADYQRYPVVAAWGDSGFVIAWENDPPYGTGGATSVKARAISIGSGSSGDDFINLHGAGGATASGGLGYDLYFVDDPGDVISELPGEGRDSVQSMIDWTLGDNFENLALSGSADGMGNGAANLIEGGGAANALAGMGGDDRLFGYEGDDALSGGSGSDSLDGGGGADVLNGGAGADVLVGGLGNDTYVITPGDQVNEAEDAGIDLIQSSISYTLSENIENLELAGSTAVDGFGNAADNRITGNAIANLILGFEGVDRMNGLGGADTLIGGVGNDDYVIGAGDSIIEYEGEGSDSVVSRVSSTLADNVENLTLSGTNAVNATGNELANLLEGNAGANGISGMNGNDTISCGDGDDTMAGGAGADAGSGGAGDDDLSGGAGADELMGNAGSDTLSGGSGADTLGGGAGADVFLFDASLSPGANRDRITDFSPAEDSIVLDDDVFDAFDSGSVEVSSTNFLSGPGTKTAIDADDYLLYDSSTGILYYDPDGAGGDPAAAIAVFGIARHPLLAPGNFNVVD